MAESLHTFGGGADDAAPVEKADKQAAARKNVKGGKEKGKKSKG